MYPDGRPGELFIEMSKEGSTIGGLMDVIGASVSIGLQYGVPISAYVNKFAHSRFEPSGFVRDLPHLANRTASSVTDAIFRFLGCTFIPGYRAEMFGEEPPMQIVDFGAAPGTNDALDKLRDQIQKSLRDSKSTPVVFKVAPFPLQYQELTSLPKTTSDAPPCPTCGALTVRCGTCYRCYNCGNSLGCS